MQIENDAEVKDFQPSDFDSEETIGVLASTSGSSGPSKSAALTHKNIIIGLPYFFIRHFEFPQSTRLMFFVSPVQWLSAILNYTLAPILGYTRLQTSKPATKDHVFYLINTYKPTGMLVSTNFLVKLLARPDRERCDFTCLEFVIIGGAKVTKTLADDMKKLVPHLNVTIAYGLTETAGLTLSWDEGMPDGCEGLPSGHLQHRIVDPETLKDIKEPNIVGELWVKGPSVFKGYYNDPEATEETFAEDGWFRTGDLFFKDSQNHFVLVDRMKSMLKYDGIPISPIEIEEVLCTHPGVHDAAVVGIPNELHGELPAAVVVRTDPGVTAQDIKDWVKDRLSNSKNLRGGVVFMAELPMTATTKLDRMKLKKMVPLMDRE